MSIRSEALNISRHNLNMIGTPAFVFRAVVCSLHSTCFIAATLPLSASSFPSFHPRVRRHLATNNLELDFVFRTP